MINKKLMSKHSQSAGTSSKLDKPDTPMNRIQRMHQTVGNQAVSRMLMKGTQPAGDMIQRASIDPSTFFGATQSDNNVNAGISGNELSGFGVKVNGTVWHTKLTFDTPVKPGVKGGHQMNDEGAGVRGVIGPDHPYGSQPASLEAAQNNQHAGNIRGMNPHGHVAAHIVNDQLGGPGISQNLFAFPGTANTLMEKKVESKMKAAVEAGNFIYYEASVQHPSNGPADSITMSWNKLDNTGADIGGGQTNEVITAGTTNSNLPLDGLAPGTEAKNTALLHPTDESMIKWTPWGPYQMPDPKKGHLLNYLDITAFPAVGNKAAFTEFFKSYNNVQLQMGMFFLIFKDEFRTFASYLSNWIGSKDSGITVKARRGITPDIVNKLKNGTSSDKEAAFLSALQSGDGSRIVSFAANYFAKEARKNARSRV